MKLSSAKIAVVGALTVLGRDVLTILSEHGAGKKNVAALEFGRLGNDEVMFGEESELRVQAVDGFDFAGFDAVIYAGQPRDAAATAKKTGGALFVDASGAFALDPDVPLVVAKVNDALLETAPKRNIVACPDPVSVFLSLALNPLHKKSPVARAVVSTYQAVSHWGREAQDELFSQTKAVFMAQSIEAKALPKQIAFNCYPFLGEERDDGLTDVESRAIASVKKILSPKIKLAINTVTVPCFTGCGLNVNVEFAADGDDDAVTPIKAAMWMTGQEGLGVIEDDDIPLHSDISSEDIAFVARLREDVSVENGLAFWLIGDNLRQGSAGNIVQVTAAALDRK